MPATTLPSSNALFGWNNYVLTAGLSASSQSLSVSNLQDERGSSSVAWQTAAGVTQNAIVTITPQILGSSWRAFGLFRTNLTPYATVIVTLWNTPAQPVNIWGSSTDGPEPGFQQSIVIADTDVQADFATIEIDDPNNPDGFLNIPLIYAGSAWQLATGPAYDTTFGYDAAIDEQVSRGGQEFPTLRWSRRRAELSFMGVRSGETQGQLAELNATAHRGNNTLFVPDITSDTMDMEAIYGRVTATADVGYPFAAADRRSWRARITERL
jgi:hypothetical protein